MSKSNLGELVNNLYSLLEPYDSEMRTKAIRAVQVLFGESNASIGPSSKQEPVKAHAETKELRTNLDLASSATEFFESKQPNSKIEELATAVRFMELKTGNDSLAKSDIEDVFVASRRNFDDKHFRRDIENAKAKGLFTKSRDKGVFTLSHFGQRYIDTLPNREGLAQLKKPTSVGRRRPNGKKDKKAVKVKVAG